MDKTNLVIKTCRRLDEIDYTLRSKSRLSDNELLKLETERKRLEAFLNELKPAT